MIRMVGERQGSLSPWAKPYVPCSSAQWMSHVNLSNLLFTSSEVPLEGRNSGLGENEALSFHSSYEPNGSSSGLKYEHKCQNKAESELKSAISELRQLNLDYITVKDDANCKVTSQPEKIDDDSILDSPCWKGNLSHRQFDDLTSALSLLDHELPQLRSSSEIFARFQQIDPQETEFMISTTFCETTSPKDHTLPLELDSNSENQSWSEWYACHPKDKDTDTQSNNACNSSNNSVKIQYHHNQSDNLSVSSAASREAVINAVHEMSNLILQYCLSNASVLTATEREGIARAKHNLSSCLRLLDKKD